jgi:hypothetical protein
MTRTIVFVVGFCMLAQISTAQITPVGADQAGAHMVRAAGMPLNDGALPPGMLTVRVVEGAFTHDLADLLVTVTIEGGTIHSARTGADGRAEFAHLQVGRRLRASVTVGSEQLESDVFEMPATSGVRLLLVTDRGRATAGGEATAATVPPTSAAFIPATVSEVQTDARRNDDDVAVTAIRAVLATTTALALAAAWLKRRPRRAS